MSEQKKILVIDDSATIRRLADNYLAPEGYQVAMAGTAEDGLALAAEMQPDLIVLDHQLPGATGYDVCCQMQDNPMLRSIPVVISSTLRNKAYVEYADLPNVVDMLPKPYTAELLAMTVKNGLDTGAMVVASQTDGSAVPEVIEAPEEAALAGDFAAFTLRETLDFLTNSAKQGILEVEGRTTRMRFYLSDGRIQGATASGLSAEELERTLPEDLEPVAPVLRMTVNGSAGAQLQGLVELLDKKVVDAQLLKRMLRYQASQLLMRSFEEKLTRFQFHVGRDFPDVVTKLPLEVSTLALLVDGALVMEEGRLPKWRENHQFTRRMSRSHSLDRSGMAPQHVKLAGLSTQPQTLAQLAEKHQLSVEESRRVLFGLSLGEVVEAEAGESGVHIAALGFSGDECQQLRESLEASQTSDDWCLHELKDSLGLKMLLRRHTPASLVLNLQDPAAVRAVSLIKRRADSPLASCQLLGIGSKNPRASLDQQFNFAEDGSNWTSVAHKCWGITPSTVEVEAPASTPPFNADSLQEPPSHPPTAEDSSVPAPESSIPSDEEMDNPTDGDSSDEASGLDSVELLNRLQAQGAFDD